jgi:CRISPR-associated protein Cas5a/b/c
MTYVAEEIASQPRCWEQAVTLARALGTGLPSPGERLAVLGCGTSYNVALAYARLREGLGQGTTDAMPASEPYDRREYDRFLFVSRSGTTTEVLEALAKAPKGVATTAIVGDANTPLGEAARDVVALDFARERSIVQTRFATSVLALLRAHLGQEMSSAIEDARRALDGTLPEGAAGATRFTFLGRGWTVGLAEEAALKLRETAQAATEAYPAMEFRHGPISVVDSESVVWSFGPPPDGLAQDLKPTGAIFVVGELDPLAELVRAQRLAVEMATSRRLDPDRPRNLAFSVVLAR